MQGADHASSRSDCAFALAERGHFVWAHIIESVPGWALAHQANLVWIAPYSYGEETALLHPFYGLGHASKKGDPAHESKISAPLARLCALAVWHPTIAYQQADSGGQKEPISTSKGSFLGLPLYIQFYAGGLEHYLGTICATSMLSFLCFLLVIYRCAMASESFSTKSLSVSTQATAMA